MNQVITNYSFSASAKTLTLTDIGSIKLERIRYVKNLTTNSYLYLFTSANTIASVVGNVITFTAVASGSTDTDKLAIQYDDGVAVSSDSNLSNLNTSFGAQSDSPASTDTGAFSLVALVKRLLGKFPSLVGGRIPVDVQSLNVTVSNSTLEISNDVGNPVPMSAGSLPLPTGAATESKQDTGNSSLSSIDGKLSGTLSTNVGNFPATQPVSATSLPLPTGAANESKQDTGNSSLSSLDSKFPPLGKASSTASTPVVLSDELHLVGASGLSALNTDLLTNTVNGWYDAKGFNSAVIQIIASAGIASGQIIFEQTNDSTNAPAGVALPAYEVNLLNANPNIAAMSIAANSIRMFKVSLDARYIRVRISTVFSGGTLQAVSALSQLPFASPTINVQQATAASLNTNVSGTVTVNALPAGTNAIGDVGIQYRANATGAASKNHFVAAGSTNATVAKASAGRLLGWQLANTTASWLYLKLHNSASAPTAGAAVFLTIAIPPNGKSELTFDGGIAFSSGIGFTTVTGSADADNTAVTLGAIVGSLVFM